MNNTQKQKANIAAAKLLGRELNHLNDIKCKHERLLVAKMLSVDIFTNHADCLAVVKKLGNQLVYIMPINGGNQWYYSGTLSGDGLNKDTYEEAVAAACLYLTNNE